MSNEFKHGQRRSRYFMAPVWISLGILGMGASFLLGDALVTDEWSRQDNEKLAEYKPGALPVGPEVGEPIVDAKGGEQRRHRALRRRRADDHGAVTAWRQPTIWSRLATLTLPPPSR